MAQGRMLSKRISLNKALASLETDTSRLLFTWTIAHLDVEGRVHGDPALLRSIVVPRLDHITTELVEEYIKEWSDKELVLWYEAEGDQWLYFPGFFDNQQGLKKDREAQSKIPAPENGTKIPTQEEVKSKSGVSQDKRPPKLSKEKLSLKEVNTNDPTDRSAEKPAESTKDKELYNKIKAAFLSQNDNFTNWGKEGKAIWRLVEYARTRAPDTPDNFIHQMIEKFWQLKQSGDKFWKGQPFLPSTLGASGIFDRVLEQFRSEEVPDELKEYYAKQKAERAG